MDFIFSSIVVLEDMNPAIIQPAWLRRLRIVDEDEIAPAEESGNLIVVRTLAQLPCKSFLLQVEPIRFSVVAKNVDGIKLLPEVTARVFSHLGHTPVRAFGVNFHARAPLGEGRKASEYMREKFAVEPSLLDRSVGKEWDIEARVTAKTTNPRIQITILKSGDADDTLKFESNFHYDHTVTEKLPGFVKERFPEDRDAFERMARELAP